MIVPSYACCSVYATVAMVPPQPHPLTRMPTPHRTSHMPTYTHGNRLCVCFHIVCRCRSRGVLVVWVRCNYQDSVSPWLAQFQRLNPDKQVQNPCTVDPKGAGAMLGTYAPAWCTRHFGAMRCFVCNSRPGFVQQAIHITRRLSLCRHHRRRNQTLDFSGAHLNSCSCLCSLLLFLSRRLGVFRNPTRERADGRQAKLEGTRTTVEP